MSVHEFPRGRTEQLPPSFPTNIEAEQGVLGAILMHNEILGTLSPTLKPEHFGEDIHRRIFDVSVQLAELGKPITIGTLLTYLGDHDLGGVPTSAYLARLAASALPGLVVVGMAKEIRDLAGRRDLIALANDLSERARMAGPSTSCVELASEALVGLQVVAEAAVEADTRRDAGTCASAMIDRARAIMRGESRDAGVSTGLPDLDRATAGGFQPGTLWIVGGRPRMGRTILATGFARKVATRGAKNIADGLDGYGSQIFSLEVTEDQIISRILADIAYSPRRRITFGDIMRGAIDEADLWAIEEAQQTLAALPLALDVAASLTVVEIAARVRSEKARMAKAGIRLAVVFVDYMKFVRATDRYRGNRVYEVGEITRGLKELAKAEGVCVVLLAQVNRAVDGRDRKDKAPGLADLRESGDLEADADVVLFVDRESVRIKQSPEYKAGDAEAIDRFLELEMKADLIVAKTRAGSETTLSVWFDAGASTFATQARGGAT